MDFRAAIFAFCDNRKTGIQGMGGSGKSTLALLVCYNDDIRKYFTDGIFWISIGKDEKRKDSTSKIFICQRMVVSRLGKDTSDIYDPKTAKEALKKVLQSKKCLLVIDDIWTPEDRDMFEVLPNETQSRILMTTRNLDLIQNFVKVNINMLDEETSIRALSKFIGR